MGPERVATSIKSRPDPVLMRPAVIAAAFLEARSPGAIPSPRYTVPIAGRGRRPGSGDRVGALRRSRPVALRALLVAPSTGQPGTELADRLGGIFRKVPALGDQPRHELSSQLPQLRG